MILVSIAVIVAAAMFCCLWRVSVLGVLLGTFFFSLVGAQLLFFFPQRTSPTHQVSVMVVILGALPSLVAGMAIGVRMFYKQKNVSTQSHLIRN